MVGIMSTNTLKIVSHGVMLSDYFSGTSGVWINVLLDKNSTYSDIIKELENEINLIFDHIEYVAESHNFTSDLSEAIEKELADIKEYCKDKMDDVFDPSLDFEFTENDDFQEYPVYIFTIEFPEE